MTGRPIQILVSRDDHSFELDEGALAAVLLQDHVKNMNVVVVSVAGALRNENSFLLETLLRYLTRHGSHGWMNSEDDESIEGFSWREGSERDAAGIFIWSEVFVTHLSNGEQVAVILMDAQGAFDSKSTVRDCAVMFALSTMLSSVQIYTLSYNIEQVDFQRLQIFTEYNSFAMGDDGHTPFQKLQFVVRNWNLPYYAGYGPNGREIILNRLEEQCLEKQLLSEHIKSCFSNISCFLLPHPGLKVATRPDFDGNLSHFEPFFKKQLHKLVSMTLAPENLLVKEIRGHKVKAKEMFQHFKSYLEFCKGAELPGSKIIFPDAAEANNLSEVRAAKETYTALMEEVCGGAKPCLSTAHLEAAHQRIRVRALRQFDNKCKKGAQIFSEPYKVKLDNELEFLYGQFKMRNKSKNFKAARTPAVFCATAGICYILSRIFVCVGIYSLPILFNLMMVNALLSFGIWAYAWNSRQMREITVYLDGAANLLRDIAMNLHLWWDNVVRPKYQYFLEMSLNRMRCMLQIQPESSNPCPGLGPKDHVHQYQVQQDGTKDEKANLLRDIVINLHLLWDNVVKPTCQYFLERSLNILRWMLQNLPKSSNSRAGSAPEDDVHQDEVGDWTTDEEEDLQWIMSNMPQIRIPAWYLMKWKEQLVYRAKLAKASSLPRTKQQDGTRDHLRKLPTRTPPESRSKKSGETNRIRDTRSRQ